METLFKNNAFAIFHYKTCLLVSSGNSLASVGKQIAAEKPDIITAIIPSVAFDDAETMVSLLAIEKRCTNLGIVFLLFTNTTEELPWALAQTRRKAEDAEDMFYCALTKTWHVYCYGGACHEDPILVVCDGELIFSGKEPQHYVWMRKKKSENVYEKTFAYYVQARHKYKIVV